VQRVAIEIGGGASLEWHPDHLIPSPGARLCQATEISMAADATLLYLDAWATGRSARGEAWGFDRLDSGLQVRDPDGPVLYERAVLGRPPQAGPDGTEGFGYVATVAAIRPDRRDWDALARTLRDDVSRAAPGCRAGVTTLGRGGVLARLLCPSAPALHAALEALWTRSRRELLGLAPLRLRKL
jgi:urease accessory protein